MRSIDFSAILSGQIKFTDLISEITYTDLQMITSDLFETIEAVIAQATDDDVVFVPRDPQSKEGDQLGWTLGHVIAHLTATLEECGAMASMLARGVPVKERLRYEVPWESIKTVHQVRVRLSESHRMCNAFLDTWPNEPHLDITIVTVPVFGPINAVGNYMLGVLHAHTHLDQLREIMRQAKDVER